MSKYTTELRFICEAQAGLVESAGYLSTKNIIATARPKIFNFEYPIFDETYRSVLETKILKHFYTREIAHETYGLWQFKLDTLLNEIMPYYNQLYKSALLEFNPFYDVDLTRSHTNTTTGTQDVNATLNITGTEDNTLGQDTTVHLSGTDIVDNTINEDGTIVNKDAYSETPQGQLSGVDDNTYLTDYRKVDNTNAKDTTAHSITDREDTTTTNVSGTNNKTTATDTTNNTLTEISNTETYLETVKGKQGMQNYSDLLIRYRDTFINIDMQIIDELNELFFNLW
jgi:hypothetical protein